MKDYIIVDSNDYVVSSGKIQDENIPHVHVPEGHRLIQDQLAVFEGKKLKYIEGKVETLEEPLFSPSVAQLRSLAYPAIGDQLEAIWEALDAVGVALPAKAQVLKQQIAEVKQRHPKAG